MNTQQVTTDTQIQIERNSIDKKDSTFLTATQAECNEVTILESSIRDNKRRYAIAAGAVLAAVLLVSLGLGFGLTRNTTTATPAPEAEVNNHQAFAAHYVDNTNPCANAADNAIVCLSLVTFTQCFNGAASTTQAVAPGTECCLGLTVFAGTCSANVQAPATSAAPAPQPVKAQAVVITTAAAPIPAPEAIPTTAAAVAVVATTAAAAAPTKAAVAPSSSSAKVLISGSGDGSYYYDSAGTGCANQPSLADNLRTGGIGYTSCEPSTGYQTLLSRGDNYIVALALDEMNANKAGLCGKQVIVKHNGVVQPGNFVVWDSCPACTGGVRLDFSLGALQEIASDVCTTGIVSGISWEVTDVQVIPYVQ
ncbi:hypothetical protein HDU98_001815 [Podochytrium sp. JEL0797]|nr:hypothetical protein HDU98_001815 [Podochytrium sp. JEL0797]